MYAKSWVFVKFAVTGGGPIGQRGPISIKMAHSSNESEGRMGNER